MPLDETTAGFIGKAELALMKPSALLVNMARGGIVDEDALYEALRGKVISGAIIDAYSQEPLTASPAVLAGQRDPVPARRGLHYGCAQRHVPHVR